MTLKYDEPLSNFAFKFKLRRYTRVPANERYYCPTSQDCIDPGFIVDMAKVWRCKLKR